MILDIWSLVIFYLDDLSALILLLSSRELYQLKKMRRIDIRKAILSKDITKEKLLFIEKFIKLDKYIDRYDIFTRINDIDSIIYLSKKKLKEGKDMKDDEKMNLTSYISRYAKNRQKEILYNSLPDDIVYKEYIAKGMKKHKRRILN